MKAFFALITLCVSIIPDLSYCQVLTFAYPNRPPYNFTVEGKPAGSLFEITELILSDADIDVTYVEMPSKRILAEIQKNGSTLCSFGWFKSPEREVYATFTLPIFKDAPLVAIFLKSNFSNQPRQANLKTLAADKSLTVGLIRGWSYGDYVDTVFKKEGTQIVEIPERVQQALMLAGGRFSYTLARQSEVQDIVRLSNIPPEGFITLPLTDLSDKNMRYIMCGKGVPENIVARINASIMKYCSQSPSPQSN